MRIQIDQNISNIMDEDRKIIRSKTSETFILFPDEGKKLRHKITGKIIEEYIALGSSDSKDNYEEVDEQCVYLS